MEVLVEVLVDVLVEVEVVTNLSSHSTLVTNELLKLLEIVELNPECL